MAVVKIIELVGSSKVSTDDAARQALKSAQRRIRNIRAVDIVSTGLRGEDLDEYRAHVRVAFVVESSELGDDID
jgi:flavin-binding protein dodecin